MAAGLIHLAEREARQRANVQGVLSLTKGRDYELIQ
jgi:hypothetical protein